MDSGLRKELSDYSRFNW